MLVLRPYQIETVAAVEAAWTRTQRIIVALPTGSGKTEIASHLIERELTGGGRALVLVERKNLCHQWRRRLLDHGFDHVGVIQAQNTVAMYAPTVIGTIQSVRARGVPERISLIVIDESHVWFQGHDAVLAGAGDDVRVLGLTATPLREGLGLRFGAVVVGATIRRLIDEGFLVRPRYFATTPEKIEEALSEVAIVAGDFQSGGLSRAMRTKTIMGDVVGTWQRLGANRQTIAFCVDKQHARDLAGEFVSVGVRADVLLDDTKDDVRSEIFAAFDKRRIRVLCSVGVLSIGFDSPVASCAILARPTLSLSLHVQQGGRVLRPYKGKDDALILDHAGNTVRHGRLEEFTPPTDLSTVDRSVDRKRRHDSPLAWVCRECDAVNALGADICMECGNPRRRTSTVVVVDGELDDDVPVADSFAARREFYQRAHWYGRSKEMRNPLGWAFYATLRRFKIPERSAHEAVPYGWRDLPPLPPNAEAARWFRADWQRRRIALQRQQDAAASPVSSP
jgi:DNA repair protein RadD